MAALDVHSQILGAVANAAASLPATEEPMNNYPELIEQAATDVAELTKEINAIRVEMREFEVEQLGEVLSASDEATGKPLFTNDKQRDYALAVRITDNATYQSLRASLADKELAKGIAQAKLERLRGEFKLHLLDRQEGIQAIGEWLADIAEAMDKIATHGVATKPCV
jgi:hypothetical protein